LLQSISIAYIIDSRIYLLKDKRNAAGLFSYVIKLEHPIVIVGIIQVLEILSEDALESIVEILRGCATMSFLGV
jgi:hypothetical protein